MAYAERTEVAASRSRDEIGRTLARYGADQFMYGWDADSAIVQFRMPVDVPSGSQALAFRQVRFLIPMPDKSDKRFTHHSRGRRTPSAAEKAWEQATRQKWRALALVVKAKLEAVEAGISEFETEFLGHVVMPDGRTVAEHARPLIAESYASGAVPDRLLLPAAS